jgi:hypothetical protein
MDTISLRLKQYAIKRKQKNTNKRTKHSNETALVEQLPVTPYSGTHAGGGQRHKVRCKQNTKSYKSLPVGKKSRDKLQETANGKLKMPTGKARNQIQRQLVRR